MHSKAHANTSPSSNKQIVRRTWIGNSACLYICTCIRHADTYIHTYIHSKQETDRTTHTNRMKMPNGAYLYICACMPCRYIHTHIHTQYIHYKQETDRPTHKNQIITPRKFYIHTHTHTIHSCIQQAGNRSSDSQESEDDAEEILHTYICIFIHT